MSVESPKNEEAEVFKSDTKFLNSAVVRLRAIILDSGKNVGSPE